MEEKLQHTKYQIGLALGLVFLSGFAALVYQVLWMKQLGLLFGNTSHAAGVTLATFFAGLATGSWIFGRRISTASNPMRVYALLEASIAATALLYFLILGLYQWIYPTIYQAVGSVGWLLFVIKCSLSLLLVFPPAFCMGGTIPVMGQYIVRKRDGFGKTAALMYGMNTLGAALGAAMAGFYLPLWIGFNATCGLGIVTSAGVALIAFELSRRWASNESIPTFREETEPAALVTRSPGERKAILVLCFLSGFGVLALEVLWTRMFTQVLENSVYTFAAILLVVLVCLGLGAFVSSRLAGFSAPPPFVLSLLLLSGAVAVIATPYVFMALTNQMQILISTGSWSSYILLIIWTVLLTIGPPALLLGTIFPYLMKVEEHYLKMPGMSLGELASVNTIGAIFGALLCSFAFLDRFGMWWSMQIIALVYLVAGIILPTPLELRTIVVKLACVAGLFFLSPQSFPVVSTDPLLPPEEVIETWEASDCTVAVTESELGIAIRINSHYSLGSTGAYLQERMQADLPLMVYPESEDLFFLGLGTGITAGSALDQRHTGVKSIVACELVPEVVIAAKKYITDVGGYDLTGGLFEDQRSEVIVEDGRHYLMATEKQFDMINADLFVPFRSGAGSLYSREHFESAKRRLTPDGVFVQWLPLYQLTENEFSIIARTMLDVFDQVSLWRHNFQPGDELVALVGHQQGKALPACEIDSRADKLYAVAGKDFRDLMRLNLPLDASTILLFYCGNLTESRELFEDYPVNTDNWPVIEFMAPRSYRQKSIAASPWFVGERLADLVEKIQELCPPEEDPLLNSRNAANRRLPRAGQYFHRARISQVAGDTEATRQAWGEFVEEWINGK